MSNAVTTSPISSQRGSADKLAAIVTDAFTVAINADTFTVTFTDAAAAIAAVEQAKDAAFRTYLRNGGNARNRRAVGSQFAAVKKAIQAAA